MEKSLDKPADPAVTRVPAATKGPAATAAPKGPATAAAPRAPAAAPKAAPEAVLTLPPAAGLSGAWMYTSAPGAWVGYGEPEAVRLELKADGSGAVRGTYGARLPGKDGMHEFHLTVEGQTQPGATSARLHWRCQEPPAEGELEVRTGADGRLLAQRTQSSDSYVPRGMEVLLRQ